MSRARNSAADEMLGGKPIAAADLAAIAHGLFFIDDVTSEAPPIAAYTASLHINPSLTSPCDERTTQGESLLCFRFTPTAGHGGVMFAHSLPSFRGRRQAAPVALLPRPSFGRLVRAGAGSHSRRASATARVAAPIGLAADGGMWASTGDVTTRQPRGRFSTSIHVPTDPWRDFVTLAVAHHVVKSGTDAGQAFRRPDYGKPEWA